MPDSFFDSAYKGIPPWDIGRPQGDIVELAEAGEIKGDVLDVGCATGENILYFSIPRRPWTSCLGD